jgi:hypothetical protein
MAKLLTAEGAQICQLLGVKIQGSVGPMGAPFVALLSADGAAALLGGAPAYSIIVTDGGKRYNAMILHTHLSSPGGARIEGHVTPIE